VICDNIDAMAGTFKIVMPDFEAFEDGEELLVVGVVVAFSIGEGAGMEGNGVDFSIGSNTGNNTSEGVVGGVSFDEHGIVRGPMR
jgi:hypothetical protein